MFLSYPLETHKLVFLPFSFASGFFSYHIILVAELFCVYHLSYPCCNCSPSFLSFPFPYLSAQLHSIDREPGFGLTIVHSFSSSFSLPFSIVPFLMKHYPAAP